MKVVSIITNNPIFIKLQYESLNKFLDTEYEYIVFNDGKNWPDKTNFNDPVNEGREAIEKMCNELHVKHYNIPNDHHKYIAEPSKRHSDSLKILIDYMKQNIDEYLVLDGDMFLVDKLNIEKYRTKVCGCVLQERPNLKYIWPNLLYINMKTIKYADKFELGLVPGGDTGSASHKWLQSYNYVYPNGKDIRYSNSQYENDDFYFIKHLWSTSWKEDEFPENLKSNENIIQYIQSDKRNTNGNFFVEIYDNCIFHYRGGTWMDMENIDLYKTQLEGLKKLI
jgi:hypothetical protein